MFVQPITVGFSIATLFCVVGLLYCRSGKKRPPALRSLELSFFCLALLYGAVIYATIEISPLGAYHRWVTVAAALFSSIFLHQFFLLFGDPVQKKWYQLVLLIEMLIAIAISALFTFRTFDAVRFFRFSGHYWDLDAVGEGRIVAAFLLLLNIALVGTGIWQAFRTEGKRRFALIASLLASVFLITIPLLFLAALRLGNITGYTFGIAMVISVTAGFFLFFVFFVSYSDFAVSLSMRILTVVLGLGLCVGQIMTVSLNRALDREYISRGFEFLARSEVGETAEAGRMSRDLVSPDQLRYIGPLIPVSEQFLGSLHSHDPLPGDGGSDVGSRRALPQVQESELPGALHWYFGREGDELQVVFRDPEHNRELRLAYVGYRSFLEQHLLQWILLLFLSYLIISIGLVFFLRATLLTPVRALLSGVDQVQAGDLEARVPTASSDELGALATAFNA
ncbi:MAG: HAMP domain-containing protein, partial [Leptospiraceae bacterium]|nr:HAMP domain-containing protein [Leptospiraceae bacterium]